MNNIGDVKWNLMWWFRVGVVFLGDIKIMRTDPSR